MSRAMMWIDVQDGAEKPDDVGFLIKISPLGKESRYEMRPDPGRTNISREATLEGWLGETNNVSSNAMGVWEVFNVAKKNPSRVQIGKLDGEELTHALDDLGYPDLDP